MYRVLKFGGSSVASATNISRVLDLVGKEAAKGRVVLVCSAISGCTDALLQMADGDFSGLDALRGRHRDMVTRLFTGLERKSVMEKTEALFEEMLKAPDPEKVTYGEIFSTTILSAKLEADGYRTQWLDSRRLIIKGNLPLTYRNIEAAVADNASDIFVAPGFVCGTPEGGVDTLGRGGSDYSAALYAAALHADSLQIWTDVPGIMTTNPKQVSRARTIPEMTYRSALEMASHGAKVLYAPTVAPAMEAGIAIEILNSFAPESGKTVISARARESGTVGIASRSAGSVVEVCLVGSTAVKEAESALAEAGIAPLRIWEEDGNVLLTVRPAVEVSALRALHRAFFETVPVEQVNLFVAGYGAVGKALVKLVGDSAQAVRERTGKHLRIVGLANSRQYGIDLGGKPEIGTEGDYIQAVLETAPKGSLFVDATSSETICRRYCELLKAGIGIVSSNRRSFAGSFTDYAAMRLAARENGVPLRYETTVGAALPILDSIARGANSCDEVLSIEAVVSCTLNQILSDYRPGGESLSAMVRKAQAAGLTEPDPRLDLGGKDALRKLLILAREAGIPLEESQVKVYPIVPPELLQGSLEAFYDGLEAYEPRWSQEVLQAEQQGFRRRFVASLVKTGQGYEAGIGLKNVAPVHPAYHLRGTENAIILRSAFHPYPLVIQGPGEGAREAASSILNDIVR
ncbi:MAG: aspartate kinase [Bacteroidales bacterium]|nr:aspartate kinase [Bacteroidales bacterium]